MRLRLRQTFLTLFAVVWLMNSASAAVVLQYHHIGSDSPPITSTTIEAFEQHLAYLKKTGTQVLPLSEVIENPTAPTVAITFDDAYADIYLDAFPLLKQYNYPFTVFVATAFVGQHGYATWDELREMEKAGGSFANHTHSHLHMVRKQENESDDNWLTRLKQEISTAETLLDKNLKQPLRYLAYPYGEYTQEILSLVSDMDYVGFGQQSGGIGDETLPALLPRFPLSGIYANFETFKTKVNTASLPVQIEPHSPLVKSNPPTLHLTFNAPENLRIHQLACYGPNGKIPLEKMSSSTFEVTNTDPLPVGRSRYNCTMPKSLGDGFHWFSQLWMVKNPDGSWYPEP